jgi:purine-binding chemotaxis protein CheW
VTQSARESTVVLLCRVGSHLCALPVEHVIETMRALPVVRLAGIPDFILGLSLIRGSQVPVVDAGQLVGAAGHGQLARFVTIKINERCVALAVDSVVGVRILPSDALRLLDPLLGITGAGAVAAIGTLDAELLVVLQNARIVPRAAWQSIEAEKARPSC